MRLATKLIFLFCSGSLMLVAAPACRPPTRVATVQQYYAWMAEPSHGLVKTRHLNGMTLAVRLLPPEYLAYREARAMDGSSAAPDSLVREHSGSLTFLFTIGPDVRSDRQPDVMFTNIRNYQEYTERVLFMNFRMDEHITLRCGGGEFSPVLTTLENHYGLRPSRSLICVFVPVGSHAGTLDRAGRMDFVYDDELFGLGINHFVFAGSDLARVPRFPWEKI